MRIIGGQAKGRRISVPPGYDVRPTSDRIKEALFNILNSVEGLKFLDLYAGTGNVGIEALSRGAEEVVFVEKVDVLIKNLKKNLEKFGFHSRYRIFRMDVEKAVECLADAGMRFDLIFADPPYRKGFIDKTIALLNAHPSILAENGWMILQHAMSEPLNVKSCGEFELIDTRRYGDTILSFLRSAKK